MLYKAFILLINIVLPLFIGALSSYFSIDAMPIYLNLNKPPLSPPGIVFPYVWTILYILMGIATFLVIIKTSNKSLITGALIVYALSLFVNFFWSIIFFKWGEYLLAFAWIILLWIIIVVLIVMYYKHSKTAAFLLVPYLLWVSFATYLTYMTNILN